MDVGQGGGVRSERLPPVRTMPPVQVLGNLGDELLPAAALRRAGQHGEGQERIEPEQVLGVDLPEMVRVVGQPRLLPGSLSVAGCRLLAGARDADLTPPLVLSSTAPQVSVQRQRRPASGDVQRIAWQQIGGARAACSTCRRVGSAGHRPSRGSRPTVRPGCSAMRLQASTTPGMNDTRSKLS